MALERRRRPLAWPHGTTWPLVLLQAVLESVALGLFLTGSAGGRVGGGHRFFVLRRGHRHRRTDLAGRPDRAPAHVPGWSVVAAGVAVASLV